MHPCGAAYLKAAKGSIVAVSSLAGRIGLPGLSAYCTAKFAMAGFFECLRAELKGAGVSVTTAFPGVLATRIGQRALNAAATAPGARSMKDNAAMPVELCAGLVVDGMNARKQDVVMTATGKLGRLLKLLAPGIIENMALAAVTANAQNN